MSQEKLAELKAKREALLKSKEDLLKASNGEIWDAITDLESKIEDLESEIEDLEDEVEKLEDEFVQSLLTEEEEKSFWKEAGRVAKAKGLPELNGRVAKHCVTASISRPGKSSGTESKSKARTKYPKVKEDYRPSEEQLRKINLYSNTDIEKNDVYVFTMEACNQDVDRHDEMLKPKALQTGAQMSMDKPIQLNHWMDVESSVGKIFDAKVYKKALLQTCFIPDTNENQPLLQKMFSGVVNKVSVHFGMNPKDYVCSSCGKSLYSYECDHYPGYSDEKGAVVIGYIMDFSDYYETSLVAVPAQPKAGFRRNELADDEGSEKSLAAITLKPVFVTENETVGKISSEKSLNSGESNSMDENEKVAPANPEIPADAAKSVDDKIEALTQAVLKLGESVVTCLDAQKKASEDLKSLVEASSEKAAKAAELLDQKFAPKSVETVTEAVAAEQVDMSAKGGLFNGILKALENNAK